MEIMEIIMDAINYPLNHMKELGIYIGIMFVIFLILLLTIGGVAVGASFDSTATVGIVGIIGIVLVLLICLLVEGYGLDVVKLGIERSDDAPSIDIARQVINGCKYIIMSIVYLIIPIIIMAILGAINDTLGLIVGIILLIIFGLALFMGACRLAETESLGYALNVKEAINDIMSVGIVKLLVILIIIIAIGSVLSLIAGLFSGHGTIGDIISVIISALVSAYMFFFQNRAIGLLYSDK